MRFHEFKEDKWSTLASRTISRAADELGPESMDYEVYKTASEMLDKELLKSLAQLLQDSDTAPREFIMKTIADHDPDTFKKMYGDQEGYLSTMKPVKGLMDAEDNTDRGMNKYGLAARHKDGKFHSYRHGKHTGSFDSADELAKHQHDLIKDESIEEDAPFGSGMELLRMAIMKKFITVQEWDLLKHKWKEAAAEVEEKYSDWPDGEGFGSSDHNFAIRDLMTAVGYEFDDQDTSGSFVVTKQPEEIEKAGIKNARMKDAVATEDEDKDVEKAKNIAKDKAGDMTGASHDIDKVKKGLSAHPDVADALKRANEELNRITKLAGLGEGADFYGYYKDPKDPEGKTFTYPNNMEFKTPHRSNANARMLLSRIGLDPDFENTGSHLIDDFIAATDKYLRMNVSDKDTNEYDEVEMYHVEANRIKKTHPEVTHVGFN